MDGSEAAELLGELVPAPRGRVGLAVALLSGWALASGAARLLLRVALGRRQPAALRLGPRGLELTHRTELLGRRVREGTLLVPLAEIGRIEREVRFARAGLYAGVLALSVGTWIGVGAIVDGLRVPGGSPSLLGLGALAVAAGAALDFALAARSDLRRGECRLVVTPRRGPAICLAGLPLEATDRLLGELRAGLSAAPPPPTEGAGAAA